MLSFVISAQNEESLIGDTLAVLRTVAVCHVLYCLER
jgi:hypothetical protein